MFVDSEGLSSLERSHRTTTRLKQLKNKLFVAIHQDFLVIWMSIKSWLSYFICNKHQNDVYNLHQPEVVCYKFLVAYLDCRLLFCLHIITH